MSAPMRPPSNATGTLAPALRRSGWRPATTLPVPIIRQDEGGQLELLPAWWKESTPPRFSFFARSEDAASKPLWRQALRSNRCLMPALGWYEWNEKETQRNPADPILAIAGLWSLWINPKGEPTLSWALLTKSAAPSIDQIHNRMPVVLALHNFEE